MQLRNILKNIRRPVESQVSPTEYGLKSGMRRAKLPHIAGGGLMILIAGVITAGQLQSLWQFLNVTAANGTPTVVSVTPNAGLIAGNEDVDIVGTNFMTDGEVQFVEISSGQNHTLAIDSLGQLYAWGFGGGGQLGNMTGNYDLDTPLNLSTTATFPDELNYPDPGPDFDNPLYGKTFKAVAAGGNHSVAIDNTGHLYMWGYSGPFFDIDWQGIYFAFDLTANQFMPDGRDNAMFGKTFWTVAAGQYFSLAIDDAGQLYAWGNDDQGQIGYYNAGEWGMSENGNPVNLSEKETLHAYSQNEEEINPLFDQTFRFITAGDSHALAINSQGHLYAWGGVNDFKLGNNSVTQYDNPVAINLSTTPEFPGDPYDKENDQVPPVINPLHGKLFKSAAAGERHSVAIEDNGDLYVWGEGAVFSDFLDQYSGIADPAMFHTAVNVSEIDTIDSDYFSYGDIPNPLFGKKIQSASANRENSFVIDSEGRLYILGTSQSRLILLDWSRYYEEGIGEHYNPAQYAPIDATSLETIEIEFLEDEHEPNPFFNKTIQSVSAGEEYVIVLDNSGKLYGWGENNSGQLGLGYFGDGDNPWGRYKYPLDLSDIMTLPISSRGSIKTIASGNDHSLAIDTTGQLWVWGSNYNGQLGNGKSGQSTPNPVPINLSTLGDPSTNPVFGKTFTNVAAAGHHSLAVDSSGQLWSWGNNLFGQIGDGTDDDSAIPINLSTLGDPTTNPIFNNTIISISAGNHHSLAIDSSGQLWSWGYNTNGQLGDGTNTNSYIPINLSALDDSSTNPIFGNTFTASVSGNAGHSLAIDTAGQLWSWGRNTNGQLGDGTSTNSNIPINLSALDDSSTNPLFGNSFKVITVGYDYSIVLDASGQLWSWGGNTNGQLGDGTSTNSNIPINLSALDDSSTNPLFGNIFVSLSSFNGHSLAIDGSSQLWSWGANISGQLGNGTNAATPSPNNLATLGNSSSNPIFGKSFVSSSVGSSFSLAIDSSGQSWSWGSNGAGQLGVEPAPVYVVPTPNSVFTPNLAPNIESVFFGNIETLSFAVLSDTLIQAVTPPHAAGPVNVAVTNDQSQTGTLNNGYTYYTIPSAPTLTTLAPASGKITLTWTAPSSNGYSTITGYKVEVSTDNGTTWTAAIADTGSTNLVYDYLPDALDDPQTSYSFRVSAINAAGAGPPSNVLSSRSGYIELTVDSPDIEINIQPSAASNVSSKSHNVSFKTNYANGVILSLSTDSETSNNLVNIADDTKAIAPTTGDMDAPAALTGNTWGFAIASASTNISNDFDLSYTEEASALNSSSHFAAVPKKGSAVDIKSTQTANPTTNNTTTVFYGASANTSIPAGRYTTTVIYSIVGN